MAPIERLHAMFECDHEGMTHAVYYAAFPPYQGDAELGSKPWWPALSQVWTFQGEIPADVPAQSRADWRAAWSLLERLHAEFTAAKARRQ